jgi:hypothetical protein
MSETCQQLTFTPSLALARSFCQLCEQGLGLLQIECVKALGEPAVDWSEKLAGLAPRCSALSPSSFSDRSVRKRVSPIGKSLSGPETFSEQGGLPSWTLAMRFWRNIFCWRGRVCYPRIQNHVGRPVVMWCITRCTARDGRLVSNRVSKGERTRESESTCQCCGGEFHVLCLSYCLGCRGSSCAFNSEML